MSQAWPTLSNSAVSAVKRPNEAWPSLSQPKSQRVATPTAQLKQAVKLSTEVRGKKTSIDTAWNLKPSITPSPDTVPTEIAPPIIHQSADNASPVKAQKGPLVITIAWDENTHEKLTGLRKQYFPPKINYLNAHLTLFHDVPLPPSTAIDHIKRCCSSYSQFPIRFNRVFPMGQRGEIKSENELNERGVAVSAYADQIIGIHRDLQDLWWDHLGQQDQRKLSPHVTICNKVTPEAAAEIYNEVEKMWEPHRGWVTGIDVWEYLEDGSWRFEGKVEFKKRSYQNRSR
ncbi:phosphoesterase HXTX [Planoprotostelium fungivorum]|uniref:Phosphoesterase HXTX n=1 Tax=Planoprotostelium fungivorum TaxID=1890364 RepID=A0A2P6NE24_9EUKA|nr:phosphoesterase HXTX [Planoprotostelium fungivorum]